MPDGKNFEGNINLQLLYQFVFVKSCLDALEVF